MQGNTTQITGLRLPNTLELPDLHTALVVGHLLRGSYAALLDEDQPARVMAPVGRAGARCHPLQPAVKAWVWHKSVVNPGDGRKQHGTLICRRG